MKIGIQKTVEILEQVHQLESTVGLKNEACRSKFLIHPDSTSKVFLFLHGFTAGPYQFEPLGKAFFNKGYNVLIPLQPGHGRSGNWSRQNPPPLPTDIQIYQQFLLEWLQIAKTLGKEVVIGGLSSGGTLAAWLALEHPLEIDRTLLFAPFFGSRYSIFDALIEILPIYFEWFNKDAPGNFGYKGFRLQALRIFLQLAKEILEKAQTSVCAPMLMVSSEADSAVSRSKHQDFFLKVLNQQPKSWYYCFDDSLHIEHRMMTKIEDNDYEELVITLAKAFVESDLTWLEFEQMAKLIAQGQASDQIMRELNLDAQVSQQLSAMMTQGFGCEDLKCINPYK
ncbi:alpha/beta fold hydrolase [Nostoc punctiforme FACHB-252]|jgi:esterase/lipase|uniref:Alpha/beta fold hydrolase n=1 Tax=Nostoc punctiforme FACHB-252 TaxID=1357509 RepID=A0ABR8HJ59_NOSPU|nr:alpha/beta fold hydrolase [Nostoc punctiforme]MBD2615397.1 alpha/beta fold hydrolase [Nostoc punctiforme FACHB-252]